MDLAEWRWAGVVEALVLEWQYRLFRHPGAQRYHGHNKRLQKLGWNVPVESITLHALLFVVKVLGLHH